MRGLRLARRMEATAGDRLDGFEPSGTCARGAPGRPEDEERRRTTLNRYWATSLEAQRTPHDAGRRVARAGADRRGHRGRGVRRERHAEVVPYGRRRNVGR